MTDDRDEVRPFFGERESVIPGPSFARGVPVVSMTPIERALQKIDAGECPTTGCPGSLDSEHACEMCGWSLTEWRMRMRLDTAVAAKPDYLPTLPGALFVDEYGPAVVEEHEAA